MFGSSRTKIWKKTLTETPRTMTISAMICDRDKGHWMFVHHHSYCGRHILVRRFHFYFHKQDDLASICWPSSLQYKHYNHTRLHLGVYKRSKTG